MRRVAFRHRSRHRPTRRVRRRSLTVALVVLVPLVGVGTWHLRGAGRHGPVLPAGMAQIDAVIDGDTVALDLAGRVETVRLLGIDTPETRHPTRPVECFGAEASARLAELLPPGTVVRLERDDEARDHFGRLLAYVHLPLAEGELFVNHLMVAEGFAVALPIEPNRAHRTSLAAAERSARQSGAGLWGRCGGPGVAVDPLASSAATASR